MAEKEFLTDSGYAGEVRRSGGMTPAAEDYLEMIFRLAVSDENGSAAAPRPVRIGELAEKLHVAPSSASRMVQNMALRGYIDFKRYGFITLTPVGLDMGEYLIRRHRIVLAFLEWLRGDHACFEEAERIEHYLSRETVGAMERRINGE
ncbi:MAG: metal-dependent transcriptional regulator, partial [Eubacteriales bacterium]